MRNLISVYKVRKNGTKIKIVIPPADFAKIGGKCKALLFNFDDNTENDKIDPHSNFTTFLTRHKIKDLLETLEWEYEEAMFNKDTEAMSILKILFTRLRCFDFSRNQYNMDFYAIY